MKNRKRIVVAFMLVAVLLLGVGYAAVTNVLDIQGSVSVSANAAENEFNEDIYFTGVVKDSQVVPSIVAGDNLGYTANINTNNNDKAQFTVTGIDETGDSVAITYQIKNDSSFDANVTLKSTSNTNPKFGWDFYFGTDGVETATITAGGTVEVTVVVSLDAQLNGADSSSFVIELNVTSIDPVVNP